MNSNLPAICVPGTGNLKTANRPGFSYLPHILPANILAVVIDRPMHGRAGRSRRYKNKKQQGSQKQCDHCRETFSFDIHSSNLLLSLYNFLQISNSNDSFIISLLPLSAQTSNKGLPFLFILPPDEAAEKKQLLFF